MRVSEQVWFAVIGPGRPAGCGLRCPALMFVRVSSQSSPWAASPEALDLQTVHIYTRAGYCQSSSVRLVLLKLGLFIYAVCTSTKYTKFVCQASTIKTSPHRLSVRLALLKLVLIVYDALFIHKVLPSNSGS